MSNYKILQILFLILIVNSAASAQETNKNLLDTIIEKGRKSHSNAVIIIRNNKILVEEYYNQKPKPEYISSAGKSLVSLAIGKLIDDGKIKSLDQPVYEFYPEWKQGTKKDITIRMLLNHTSGLQNNPNASIELEPPPLYKVKNIVQLALCAEISDKPGTVFNYNNKAVALLGGIIEKASGQSLDKYFEENFYGPMDIKQYDWIRDESGNPTAYGAFILKPMDFAKFGLLILNGGVYNSQKIISAPWIDQAFQPGQPFDLRFGLLWWRLLKIDKRVINEKSLKLLEEAQVNSELIAKLRPLLNDTLSVADFNLNLANQLGNNWYQQINTGLIEKKLPTNSYRVLIQSRDAMAYYADGFRGNYLVIIPSLNLVAVRVRGSEGDYNPDTDDFDDFVELIAKMTK